MQQLGNHWHWRPEWRPERVCVYWYLTFGDDLARVLDPGGLDAVRAAPWLDAVPPRWLHVTLCDVGFTDELDAADVERVLAAGRPCAAETNRLNLGFGVAAPMDDAVVLPVEPLKPLRHLQRRLRSATEQALGPGHRSSRARYWPHLSLGYANQVTPAVEVDSLLGQIGGSAGEVTVERLMLVAVDRDQRHYRWTVLGEVPLARASVDA